MTIQFDHLTYDTEVLLAVYRGRQQIFAMPSILPRRCWLFISKDLVDAGFVRQLPRRLSLKSYGPSPCNRAFLAYGCTWGTVEQAIGELQSCFTMAPL